MSELNELLLGIENYMNEKNLSKTETSVAKLVDLIAEEVMEQEEF
ncbi:hypothetical protein P9X10_00510 [Bacillus cereus]|nr:hypothetical protein [Bacillus cereus]